MTTGILIYDRSITPDFPASKIGVGRMDLFPLTDDWACTGNVRNACGQRGVETVVLESSEAINEEVDRVRSTILRWSAELGDHRVGGLSIKQWFSLPASGVSAWWFSLLSETNTLKSDAFFQIARLQAVKRRLQTGRYDLCVVSIDDPMMRKAVKRLAAGLGMKVSLLQSQGVANKSRRLQWRQLCLRLGFLGTLIYGWAKFVEFLMHSKQIKSVQKKIKRAVPKDDAVLIVSYFPSLDMSASERGEFRNNYFAPLQALLRRHEKNVNWLLMCTPPEGMSIKTAARLAGKFEEESLYFSHGFVNSLLAIKIIFLWVYQVLRYGLLMGLWALSGGVNLALGWTIKEANYFLLPLWRESFAGWTAFQAILYFELFKRAMEKLGPHSTHCVYFCEMQAWEKALNAAKEQRAPHLKSVGFQHAAVSKNHFFYFHDPSETQARREPFRLPLPDVLAASGEGPFSLLNECRYPNLCVAEALRHLHLASVVSTPAPQKPSPALLLLVTSMNERETASLLLLLKSAFPRSAMFRIGIKPHPACNFEAICRDLDFRFDDDGYEVIHRPLEEALEEAVIVMGGESSAMVDALAFGCEVIVPLLNDAMLMSPLQGHENHYRAVRHPEELRDAVKEILASPVTSEAVTAKRDFVRWYWRLDPGMTRWKTILDLAEKS